MRTLADLVAEFPAETGLTDAQVADSRRRYGSNRLTPLPHEPAWRKFLEKFDEPIIRILLVASLLKELVDLFGVSNSIGSAGLGLVAAILLGCLVIPLLRRWLAGWLFVAAIVLMAASIAVGHPSFEGAAIMTAVVLATGVAFFAEYRSDREFEILNAGKEAISVKVMRNGEFHTIALDDVVVGDRVGLEMGDEIPADGWVIRATDLEIDQSLMTGESEAVGKNPTADDAQGPEQPGCLYRGTQVLDGVGKMLVAAVGDDTMLGEIAHKLGPADSDRQSRVAGKLSMAKEFTPLQWKLKKLADTISTIGYVAAVAIFVALVGKGLIDGAIHWPQSRTEFVDVSRFLLNNFVIMVIIIVVAVPEGLPMSVTISLALAMRKMTRANSLVRQLVACETIGSATVICCDKTGTLTQNRMQVVGIRPLPESERPHPRPLPEAGRGENPLGVLRHLVLNAAVNSTAELEDKNGKQVVVGNSTEGALLRWLADHGHDYRSLRQQFPPLYQLHFSSERKRMTTVIRDGERLIVLVKGAPEIVLDRSVQHCLDDGTARPLDETARSTIIDQLRAAAEQSVRTLALAVGELPSDISDDSESLHARRDQLECNLTFLGFVMIRDPLRPNVHDAVAECRAAGIEVKMITGDVAATARAIAAEVGLLDRPDALVMTSAEFQAASDAELAKQLPRLRVLARARPLDKYRLVNLLQEQGEVVAMTGDGTNDAPSLKKADVGLAMGLAGTEVAKEASKIVLLDDSFATIVNAVRWGRALFENIQRFVQFQLTINVSALVIAFLAPFVGFGEPPFTVLQFLWINMIMDTLAAIALCSEPPRPGLMREPPKRREDSIVSPRMLTTLLATAAFFVVCMLVMLIGMKGPPNRPGWWAGDGSRSDEFPLFTVRQATIFFTTYVLFQVWNLINCRSLTPWLSGLAGLGRNGVFLLVAGLIVLGQIVIVNFGGTVFQVEPLRLVDWLAIAAGTASVVVFAELLRWVQRLRVA